MRVLTKRPGIFRQSAMALVLAGLMATGLGTTSANAQDHAERMANINAEHAQRMNDYGHAAAQDYANSQYDYSDHGSDNGYYSSYSPPAPLTLEQQYLIQAQQRDSEIMAQLQSDPRYYRYINGGWDFYKIRQPAGPGEYCAATYLSRHGIITLTGLDKSSDGALLMLAGAKVPRPEAVEKVTATLSQTGAPPATVQAFLFAANPAAEGFGTIVFTVPSMDDALRTMLEDNNFVVEVDGQQIFHMGYEDGTRARDELQGCVSQR